MFFGFSTGDSGEYRELTYLSSGSSSSAIGGVTNPSMLETFNNGTLLIPKVGREHEGSYLCQANNGIGAGLSILIKLTVHGKHDLLIFNVIHLFKLPLNWHN